jgi:hypothetical protein
MTLVRASRAAPVAQRRAPLAVKQERALAEALGFGTGGDQAGAGGSTGGATGGSGGSLGGLGGSGGSGGTGDFDNPKTCAEAAGARTYVGCEFWPTITANPVYLEFDPAVVVANGTTVDATVAVDGPAGFHQQVSVAPGALQTILLRWVPELKGPEFSLANTSGGRLTSSVRVDKGSYHLTSTVPVTAWQFNPIQYRKPASACPRIMFPPGANECRSASVDASLLFPTNSLTGNYRIFAYASKNDGKDWGSVPGGAAITATKDGTQVKVQLAPKCGVEIFATTTLGVCVSAGPGVDAKNAGEIYTFQMNAGDVVQLVGAWSTDIGVRNADMSGSVVNATAPVQVVSFNAIAQLPDGTIANGDHIEETVLPAEAMGNKYIVVPPTAPLGKSVGHVVRIYGNVNGTTLTYPQGAPPGAPAVINEGEVVQIPPLPKGQPAPLCTSEADHCMTNVAFIVQGDKPFAVASFMVGGMLQTPGADGTNSQGDPSMTMLVAPEQFRKNYTFVAPTDYLENFADVVMPVGAPVMLDGSPLSITPERIGTSEWSVARAPLNGTADLHTISTTDPRGVGLQVVGFGFATSFYYPGGLDLKLLSIPPIIR